jgi:glutamyl-tRNA synthetase
MSSSSPVKVRFAPSPTGELHLGGARTALFNWLYAKKHKGSFFLRIEDTDKERSKQIYTDQILDSLKWLGLDWDDPLIYQSGRLDRYKHYLNKLFDEGKSYRCFCSKSDIENYKEDTYTLYPGTCRNLTNEEIKSKLNQGISFTVRIKLDEGVTVFDDLVYGAISTNNKELDDFIIARSDGSPTYNFTVVIDDYEMEISHVIRGDDHLSNTPKQIIIYNNLELKSPLFAHLPMILGSDKKRLSKRHGAPGVQNFNEMGYFPDSLLNYLALLGWNPKNEREVLTSEELIESFSFERVQKKGAVWDEKKLHWLSGQHVLNKAPQFLLEKIRLIDPDWGMNTDLSRLLNIIDVLKPRAKSLKEFVEKSKHFFYSPKSYNENEKLKAWPNMDSTKIVSQSIQILDTIDNWSSEELEKATKTFASDNSYGVGKVIMPLRLAVFGSLDGPSLFEIMTILGKKETLARIKNAINSMPKY